MVEIRWEIIRYDSRNMPEFTWVHAYCLGFGDYSCIIGERENSGAQCGDIIRQVLHHSLHMLILDLDFEFVFMLKLNQVEKPV